MLRIRKEQRTIFADEAFRDFEHRMFGHLKRTFPIVCARIGEQRMRAAIRHGIERASLYGIVTERGVCMYIDIVIAFGIDFDQNQDCDWAIDILTNQDLDQFTKANQLFDEGLARLHAPCPGDKVG